jgi:hypothetical protein
MNVNPKAELLLVCHLQWVNFFKALDQGPVGHSINMYLVVKNINQCTEEISFY